MSSSNCCFLTCIQISQEAGQVVWYSHLLKHFPQFIGIHTVKVFGIVSKVLGSCTVEVWPGGFWALPCLCVKWALLCGRLSILWHCLSLGLQWKLTFSSPVATAEFSKFAGILSEALSQPPFRIWSSSTGIPSPPLALFVVMLPKAHLTSHSRMSGSRWVITPSWLSGSWRSFLYSSSVYSYHLFLISSVFLRSIQFLSFIEPIFAWNVALV